MTNKTSIRFFEGIPVRAVWDEESSKWWFCAVDITKALTDSANPRVYWETIKRRNPQLFAICKQLKLEAADGKFYNTDVVDENGLNTIIALIPSKKADVFNKWIWKHLLMKRVNKLLRNGRIKCSFPHLI